MDFSYHYFIYEYPNMGCFGVVRDCISYTFFSGGYSPNYQFFTPIYLFIAYILPDFIPTTVESRSNGSFTQTGGNME